MVRQQLEELELSKRIKWLINLRWVAVAGVFGVLLFANRILALNLPYLLLYSLGLVLFLYNLVFFLVSLNIRNIKHQNRFANFQIILDLITLTLLLHFSGGMENPFIFYFIFHVIIASILLSKRDAYLQASLAALLVIGMAVLEYMGIISHYPIFKAQFYSNSVYVFSEGFAFVTTLYIAVYMAASISSTLRQRNRELRDLNAVLKEQDRIKSEYVMRVSHDIQAHLGAIDSCLKVVVKGYVDDSVEKTKDFIKRADHRVEVLLRFVRDLLELAKAKLKKSIKLEAIDLTDILKKVLDDMQIRVQDKEIELNVNIEPGLPIVNVDKVSIREVFMNLVSNALKYTPKGGSVDVTVKEQKENILVEISDTGIGIQKNDLDKIFNDFYRTENAKQTEQHGTGLGLSIVKQIVEKHHGKIWVESELGKGSVFSFTISK